ncbi:MAG: arylsulfatase, partial [Verrucomicrobia bacterium]|nr:arylsulfatase [Verrucomicrobiota bacterium]
MKPTLLLSLLACLATLSAAPRPNIVLIMADDLGFADLGCYGSEIETPHLDALARDGLRFTQFYNTAKCHSSRVSLLTGLYCDQADGENLSRGATIAEALAPAGYHTMMVGKWHLSKQPTDFGFQRYWGHLSGSTNYFTGDNTFRLDGKDWTVPETLHDKPFYTTDANIDFAIQFLNEHQKSSGSQAGTSSPPNNPKTTSPFILYLAFNAPHYPLQAPKEAIAKYKGRYDAGWDVLREERHQKQRTTQLFPKEWGLSPRPDHVPAWDSLSADEKKWEARRMEVYAAMVDILDQNVGRLIAHLKASGQWDNTLLLFCSDNGACPFERTRRKELDPWNPKSYWTYDVGWAHLGNTPFRLYKQNQHEGGISSPLIVHTPESLQRIGLAGSITPDPTSRASKSGALTDQPAHLIDFMATFLEVSGTGYPKQVGDRQIDPLQGLSLLPILRGEQREPHETLYFHFSTDRALRQGDWKLVAAKGGPWELYNVKNDRTELHDLAAQEPKRLAAMKTEWFRLAKDVDRLPPNQLKPAS